MVRICDKEYTNDQYDQIFDKYPFPLSDFQKYAIEAIELDKHILVTAHTGSGKTLPAEYAVQKFVADGKKVIYTAPIKALSNQKFYEFTKKFPDISFGILTGDIKFNPEADCLIMTTEILRNALFHKQEVKDFQIDIDTELACVVFDEVHYINDADRGKVWEETIMMLPKHIQMVMLSATIDKPESFANWIETKKEKDVYLACTDKRVVPLTHYSYLTAPDAVFNKIKDKTKSEELRNMCNRLITLKDSKGFNEINYHKMNSVINYFDTNHLYIKRNYVINNIIKYLKDENMLPAICFIFSRKMVETYAQEITLNLFEEGSKIPSIIQQECMHILIKLPNYKEYVELSEFRMIVKLLQKGIAIHHSGILPVFREMIELLFAKGYIKLLFATETFAVGINMPTKTVIFTAFQKFNNGGFRNLYSHEYTQMAGRAGRRGIDILGNVIHLNNIFEVPSVSQYRLILTGKPQTLVSKFKIHYNLILNLVEEHSDELTSFVEKSMIQDEIMKEYNATNTEILKLKRILEQKPTFKSKLESLESYIEIKNTFHLLKNKKRRHAARQMMILEDVYPDIENDYKLHIEINKLKENINKEERKLSNIKDYINYHVSSINQILLDNKFIEVGQLTNKGKIATILQEVHGLAFADMYIETNGFKDFTVEQLIGLFSCFTTVKVPDDYKSSFPSSKDELLNKHLNRLYDIYNKYYDVENKYKIDTGIDYTFHFDLIDEMIKWSTTQDEAECKQILYNVKVYKNVFIGEFIKAILKINNIVNEFEKVSELLQNIELLHKLKQISDKTLKFVATNQSLYLL